MVEIFFNVFQKIIIGFVVLVFTATLLAVYYSIWLLVEKPKLLTSTELRGFLKSYSTTPEWAFSALGVSILALTIGSDQSIHVDTAILLLFLLPAVYHLKENSPFGLWAKIPESQIRSDSNDIYSIDLEITAGSNVDELLIDIDAPLNVTITNFQSPTSEQRLSEEDRIRGKPPIDQDHFTVAIYAKASPFIGYDNNIKIYEMKSGRVLTSVELL